MNHCCKIINLTFAIYTIRNLSLLIDTYTNLYSNRNFIAERAIRWVLKPLMKLVLCNIILKYSLAPYNLASILI